MELEERIRRHCARGPFDVRTHYDDSLPEEYSELWQFKCLLRAPDGRVAGLVPFTLQGCSGRNRPRQACAIRIGPAPIRAPVPLDMVLDWLDDQALANKLRLTAGIIPYEDDYEISFTTGGVHVWMQQYLSLLDGANMELSIDGCGRIPDERVRRNIGVEKVFEPLVP
jgi:hypothetical protein